MPEIDPAAVDAAIARMQSGIYDHGRERSLVGIEPARLADLETIADACEHYRGQLAAVTERERGLRDVAVRMLDVLTAEDNASAVISLYGAFGLAADISSALSTNQEGNDALPAAPAEGGG